MKKILPFLITICLFWNTSVQGQYTVNIDITEAIKSQADFKLSDLVSKVELLTLKSEGKLMLGDQPQVLYFGHTCILMRSEKGDRIGLYDRSGMLKTTIGRIGKGPGEYPLLATGTMDPLEKFVVLYDQTGQKLMLFDVTGQYLRENKVEAPRPSVLEEKLAFTGAETFGLMIPRPSAPTGEYASIRLFNLKLEPVGKVLPRANDSHLVRYNDPHAEFIATPEGPIFWETLNDTIFRVRADGKSIPLFCFNITKNKIPESILQDTHLYDKDPTVMGNYCSVNKVFLTPGFVIAQVAGSFSGFVFTNRENGKTFSTSKDLSCKNPSSSLNRKAYIENDIYGMEAILFEHYWPESNALVGFFPAFYTKMLSDLDCIRKLNVRQPEIRDKLLSIIKEELFDDEVVLVVHQVRN